jgi:hypothetical protein
MQIQQINTILNSARDKFKNFSKGESTYLKLLADTSLLNYFRRYYPFSELPGLRTYLSRSRYYDGKFIEKIASEISQSKLLFENNLKHAANVFGQDFKIKADNRDLETLYALLDVKLFKFLAPFAFPNPAELISKLNLRASSGLREPWFHKRYFLSEISSIAKEICSHKFSLYESLLPEQMFTAAFKRFQITSKAMKARLVFCLTYPINVAEAMFDIPLKQSFGHPLCPLVHGKTQVEISKLITRHKRRFCLSFDVKEFDLRVPGEIVIMAFNCMAKSLHLVEDSYLSMLLNDIRDLNLCMPVFHPVLELTGRKRGISSGSGLTSSLDSFCMYIMLTMTLMDYCNMHKINIFRVYSAIFCSGDDSMLFTSFKINPIIFISIFKRKFDMDLELEGSSDPFVDSAFFLGSEWTNGTPTRNINRMFARILFGSPNMPKMDNSHVLFCSRAYDILGNVGNFEEIWSTFKVPMSDRIFRFSELADFGGKTKMKSMNLLDRRGFWETRDPTLGLDRVWTTR